MALVAVVVASMVALASCDEPAGSRAGAAGTSPPASSVRPPGPLDLGPYGGLGTWVDAYDFARPYQSAGAQPPIGPDDVDDMARRGVRTLFLQAARWDDDSPQGLVDPERLAAMLARAHERGLRVVGWYLPDHVDVGRDLERARQIVDFRAGDDRFDGLAIDIEYTRGEPDPAKRNAALVDFSQQLRREVTDRPIAAVVLTAVHLDVVNPRFWPDFPYGELADLYDVWMPMAYWTMRTGDYHNSYNYTRESVERLRDHLGRPDAVVAPIGGIADETDDDQIVHFGDALVDTRAIGGSFYDWNTMAPNKQALAARLFGSGRASTLPAAPPWTPPACPPPVTDPTPPRSGGCVDTTRVPATR